MHPHFLEFLDRLAERPHNDKQAIALFTAFVLTLGLFAGKLYLFPYGGAIAVPGDGSIETSLASVGEGMREDIGSIRSTWNQIGETLNRTEEVLPAVPLSDGSAPQAAPAGWVPAADGGGYYEYPKSVIPPAIPQE